MRISFFMENMYNIFQEEHPEMTITTTELKEKQAYYLSLASWEDIIVTKNGKFYVRITGARKPAIQAISSLFGILPSDIDEKNLLEERVLSL